MQSPQARFGKYDKAVIKYGHSQCQIGHILFVKSSTEKRIVILNVYVDDNIIRGNYEEEFLRFKKLLAK